MIKRPRLTLVTPVYNEEDNLDSYAREVASVFFNRDDLDTCVLFVDDGSTDRSWSKISELAARSDRFHGLRLSRNFGAHPAIAAGLDNVDPSCDLVATLACDLQDPPDVVVEFVEAWRKGAQIVWGARRSRAEHVMREVISRSMEALLRRYAMPRHSRFTTGSFLLMDRAVLDCFRQFREHSRVTFALVAWTGFEQAVVQYDRRARRHGEFGLDARAHARYRLRCVRRLFAAASEDPDLDGFCDFRPEPDVPGLSHRFLFSEECAARLDRIDDRHDAVLWYLVYDVGHHGRVSVSHFPRGEGTAIVFRGGPHT